jgi:hypothetical protein
MAEFKLNTSITTTDPAIEVTVDANTPLSPGVYRFQLVVVDDSGNASDPAFVEVLVKDTQKPTAVLDAPSQVEFGQSFKLSGERSADAPPGKVVQYVWTLVPDPNRPPVVNPPVVNPPVVRPPIVTPPIIDPPVVTPSVNSSGGVTPVSPIPMNQPTVVPTNPSSPS